MLEKCDQLNRNEAIISSQASTLSKFDMTKCKVLSEPVVTNAVVLYFRKHHYLVKAIDRKISLFKAAGLIEFWISCYDRPKDKRRTNGSPKVITVYELSGIFQIWIYCMTFAFLVFCLELLKRSSRLRRLRSLIKN